MISQTQAQHPFPASDLKEWLNQDNGKVGFLKSKSAWK